MWCLGRYLTEDAPRLEDFAGDRRHGIPPSGPEYPDRFRNPTPTGDRASFSEGGALDLGSPP